MNWMVLKKAAELNSAHFSSASRSRDCLYSSCLQGSKDMIKYVLLDAADIAVVGVAVAAKSS